MIDAYENEGLLLQQIAAGDHRGFTYLVGRYASKVYAQVMQYIKHPEQAEEITQDIFLGLWQGRTQLHTIHNFGAYLHVVTRNRTISALRKKLASSIQLDADVWETTLTGPAEQLELRELSDALQEGMNKLPPRRREIFRMSRVEGKTYDQIAQELGISRATVNEHIVEAIQFLHSHLKGRLGSVLGVSVLLHTWLAP